MLEPKFFYFNNSAILETSLHQPFVDACENDREE
jgi:hypothetical protein